MLTPFEHILSLLTGVICIGMFIAMEMGYLNPKGRPYLYLNLVTATIVACLAYIVGLTGSTVFNIALVIATIWFLIKRSRRKLKNNLEEKDEQST